MDHMYKEAENAGLGRDVIEIMRNMQLTAEDILGLTRSDINAEFHGYNYTIRKDIWKFFQNLRERCGGTAVEEDQPPLRDESFRTDRDSHSEASSSAQPPDDPQPDMAPPPYSPPLDSYDGGDGDGDDGGGGGDGVNVRVERASGSNIAGGDINSTTYNIIEGEESNEPKYRIQMNDARGVALGDGSSVTGNEFN